MTTLKLFMHKTALSILASCTVCITALFFSAGLVYYTNINEYSIPFSSFLKGMAIISWPIMLAIVIVLIALPKKYNLFQRGIAVTIVAALGAYLYSTFILWHYGVLGGEEINWSAYWYRGIVDIVVALALFLLLYKYWQKLYLYAVRICLCLLIIQFVTLASYHWTGDAPKRMKQNKYIDTTYSMDFSEKENLIFIVLDSLSYDVFESVITDKKYSDYFKSFVSFTDCAAGFPATIVSIGLMLTGKYYDNSAPVDEYYSSALSSPGSLTDYCRQNDFYIKFNSVISRNFNDSFAHVADNTTNDSSATANEVWDLTAAALFRSFPHFFKRAFINRRALIENNDTTLRKWDFAFLDAIQNTPFIKSHRKPVFSFIHLVGFHGPHKVDENFQFHEQGVSQIAQAKACLNLVKLYMDELRNNGLFDNSTIVITADHTIKRSWNSAHVPLLVKPRNAGNEDLKPIDIPVSLADIPSIAVNLIKDPAFDLDYFKPQEKRYYNIFVWAAALTSRYLSPMTRYEVRGPAANSESYILVGTVKSKFLSEISLDASFKVDFLRDPGESKSYTIGNFEYDETAGLIPVDRTSYLVFSFNDISVPYIKMTFDVTPINNKRGSVRLRGYDSVRKRRFDKLISTSSSTFFYAIDEFSLQFHDIASIASIKFEPFNTDDLPKVEIGKEYLLSDQYTCDMFATNEGGFSSCESPGVWTLGSNVSLLIPWQTIPANPIVMDINVSAYVKSNWPKQRVFAYVGDTLIAEKEFIASKAERWRIELDPHLFSNDKEWRIRFDLPDNVSPKKLGVNNSNRSVALRFKSMQFLNVTDESRSKKSSVR